MLTLSVKAGMIKWANLQTRFGARQQGQQGPLSGAYLSLASLSSYTDLVCLNLPPKPLFVSDVGPLSGPCLSSVSLSGFRVGFLFQDPCLSPGSLPGLCTIRWA